MTRIARVAASVSVLVSAVVSASEVVPAPTSKPTGPSAPAASPPALALRDVTAGSGVDFRGPHSAEKRFILESVSGGVALLDLDGDELLDLFLVGSLTVDTADRPERGRSALYRGTGDGSMFDDVSRAAGADLAGWGVGVCAGDVDGDGRIDLYVTGVERNWLLHNRSGARGLRFEEIASDVGVAGGGWSTGCGFADADGDGDLDLFVARYLDLRLDDLPEFGVGEACHYRDVPVQCGPRGLPGRGDLFFRNDGPGDGVAVRFHEMAREAGLDDAAKLFGLGVTWVDVDLDGRLDLYVANDTGANFLYRNRSRDGAPRFEESAHFDGVAVTEDGKEQGSMGIAVGDYDNNGWPSLFVTNFSEEQNVLYRSQGGDYFQDASFSSGLAAESLPFVGWGTAFVDFDNDGWLDLVVANGHVYPQMDEIRLEASRPYLQRGMLYRNLRNGRFEQIVADRDSDDPLAARRASRGLAAGDIDGDGRVDLVITDLDAETRVLRNVTTGAGHWLSVRLLGRGPRRDAVGAHLTLRTGERRQTRQVLSGTSYLSQHPLRQHFGLGDATRVDEIEVRWPDGSTSSHGPFAVDRRVVIEQPARSLAGSGDTPTANDTTERR
ncbi:MAG: CRTAC1 family protein [Acidobacteriota bacterium]